MITIEITPAIEKEINQSISSYLKHIDKEMAISADLRNYALISKHAASINDLKYSLQKGVI